MREKINILATLFLLTFLSCNNSIDRNRSELKQDTLSEKENLKVTDNQIIKEKNVIENTNLRPSDCVRSTPESIVNKSVFPNSNFTFQADSLTGIETVEFENGDKLIIENSGCEYVTLNFRFVSSRFKADTTDTKYWADKALKLIKESEHGIDAPVNLKNGIKAFEKYISKTELPKLQEEIDYGMTEIRSFVYLNRIQKLPDSKFAVELTFSVGPL